MSIINYLKSTLVESIIEDEDVVSSEEQETVPTKDAPSFEGNPKALVDDLINEIPITFFHRQNHHHPHQNLHNNHIVTEHPLLFP